MSVTNMQVAHAWAHGHSAKGSNLKTDGITLTSYYTTIAAKIDGVYYISSNNMSMSTSRHISYACQAVGYNNPDIFYTCAFSWSGSNPALTHRAMILPAAEEAVKELVRALASTKTRQATKIKAIQAYIQERERITAHAARFGVEVFIPEMAAEPGAIEAYQEAKRAAEAVKEAARIKAQKKQQRQDKKQLKAWLETGAGYFPTSFRVRGEDQITIKGGYATYKNQKEFFQEQEVNTPILKVVTSQGAECPLDHAIKAIKFWRSRDCTSGIKPVLDMAGNKVEIFIPYHTNGHKIPLGIFTLDSIDEAGTVKAGCHTFTAKEIQRFINQWREVLGL